MRRYPPFESDAVVAALGRGFLDLSLPKSAWTHAGHFGPTLWLLKERPDIDLPREMPALIRRFNEAKGGVNSDTEGYHETITQASIRAARWFWREHSQLSLHELANALMASRFGEPDWLLSYWNRSSLFSVAARLQYLEPDIQPLPY